MHSTIRVFLSCVIFCFSIVMYGQNNTLSPYSRYGIGEISHKGFAPNSAMGGLKIGLRQNNQINYLNPASYTSQDTMSFIFDVGMKGNYTIYETSTLESINSTANIDHMAISFPIKEWCFMSAGLNPFSSIGYSISDQYYLEGLSVVNYFDGEGGISQFYLGTSIKLLDKIALGVNASYLFGAMNYDQYVTFADPITYDTYNNTYITRIENKNVVGDFYFDFGLQYFDSISDNLSFTVGAVFNNQTSLSSKNSHNKMLVREDLNYPYTIDTLSFVEDEKGSYTLPLNIGGGFTLNYNNRLLFGLDYSVQNWASIDQYKKSGDSLSNSNLLSAGLEYTPNPEIHTKGYLKKVHYRLGGFYENTYLNINGQQLKDYGITFGLGLPFKRYQSSFNIACELGQRGTINNNLIKESYAIWTISLTLKDLWFYKSKFD